jgi:hypothetical protein
MSKPEVHAYDYVTSPYDQVKETLKLDAIGVFQRASGTATARARSLVSTMRATIGPLEVGADVIVRVTWIDEVDVEPFGPTTRLHLSWEASSNARLFPVMEATLSAFALSPTETQIELRGTYVPPLGAVGAAFDRLVGHRIAEAAVHRFVEDVAERLRNDVRAANTPDPK